MQLRNHYYSMMSGLAASLGSFFGKMITFTASKKDLVSAYGMSDDVSLLLVLCVSMMRCHITFFRVAWFFEKFCKIYD
jgi:hypothetical protein